MLSLGGKELKEKSSLKRKVILGIIISIPIIFVLIVGGLKLFVSPTNEEIIEKVKNIKNYKSSVEFIITNDREELKEQTLLQYSKEKGSRIDFGDDRVKTYINGEINVKDKISGAEYKQDAELDIVHSLAIIDKILSYDIDSSSIIENQEEWGNTKYIEAEIKLPLDIKHLSKAKIFIDKDRKEPIGTIIYNKDGKEKVRIIYKDFEKMKEISEDLL